jgi:hypothetical protein
MQNAGRCAGAATWAGRNNRGYILLPKLPSATVNISTSCEELGSGVALSSRTRASQPRDTF